MKDVRFINNFSEISLGKGWVDAPTFKSKNRFINEKGEPVGSDYTGKLYQILYKKERAYSYLERIGRIFVGSLAVLFTFGIALRSKAVYKLFHKKGQTIRFAQAVTPKPTATPKQISSKPPISSAKTQSPMGFPNYGESCWFASSMQMLLTSDHFESIVRQTQAKQGPQPILNALLDLIEQRNKGDEQRANSALRKLHEALCNEYENMDRPGKGSDPYEVFDYIYYALGAPDRFLKSVWIADFFVDPNPPPPPPPIQQVRSRDFCVTRLGPARHEHPFKKLLEQAKPLPDLIYIRNTGTSFAIDHDQVIDLSKHLHNREEARYRVIGVTSGRSGHETCFVRAQNLWYFCDDHQVRQASLQEVNAKGTCKNILLERVKN